MGGPELFLGGGVSPGGTPTSDGKPDRVLYDADDLTTHGVIVGMTGSGKTGLGVVLLEELLLANIPTLIIDPKGDMGNLALRFPNLSPEEFKPWLDLDAIRREGKNADEVAAETATRWSEGLAEWELGKPQLQSLADVPLTIYTPGSKSGAAVNILGSLDAPTSIDWEEGAENVRAEIEGTVTGLLGLIEIDADPLTSREHILLSNLIERAWRKGESLDIAMLIGQVQDPPLRKLGVFELDKFFPAKDRTALAMRLNGLVANPSFQNWMSGAPLDIEQLLFGNDGRARASIFYLAHLSEPERQFVVTLLLSKVATWMQTQKGTGGLRALVYMDEVFGFVPPSAQPPSKKPILTLLKQARAFGVGLVLSTQNPVDLDYKAMSNAGTWMIGRLQTERDKARILEALQSAQGGASSDELAALISGLGKRQFLLHNTRESAPTVFSTRWAMSYLAGPLAKSQLKELSGGSAASEKGGPTSDGPEGVDAAESVAPTSSSTSSGTSEPSVAALAEDETELAPDVAEGRRVLFLDPSAPWAEEVGAVEGGKRHEAALCARVNLVFDDTKLKLETKQEFEAVFFPLEAEPDAESARILDFDTRDFRKQAPEGTRYVLPDAPVKNKKFFAAVEKALKTWVYKERKLDVLVNRKLKLASRPGETEDAFNERCAKAAGEKADEEAAKLRTKLATKLKSIERKEQTAERQRDKALASHEASKTTEVVSGVGSVLSVLLGGKSSTKAIARRAASQARSASSRRAASKRSRSRVGAAESKLEDLAQEREDLEEETLATLSDIDAKWSDTAADVETVEVGLERRDIEIEDLALVWIPTE